MANVGTAHLLIVPKFDNLSDSVTRALGGVNVGSLSTNISAAASSGIKGGISAATVAVGNLISNAISAGVSMVTSHVDSAISRVDTLNNYPLVMQAFGVSADEATASIDRMSERLQNLPTKLDDMASSVQGLFAAGEKYGISLSKATEAGLALNDLLLAGGGSTQVVSSALEQFRQVVAKGKPDMQDWRALISAAPGQMNQLAHSILGASTSAQDLYYALGGGKESEEHTAGVEYASVTINELLDALIRLDEEGGDAISSFADQAETAQGGIATSWANFGNAWTRGIAGTIEAFGRDNIVGVINEWKGYVKGAFADFNDWLPDAVPTIMEGYEYAKGVLSSASGYVGNLVSELAPSFERVLPLLEGAGEFFIELAPHIGDAVESVVPALERFLPIVEFAGSVVGEVVTAGVDIVGAIGDFVVGVDDGAIATWQITEAMKGLTGEIADFSNVDMDTQSLVHAMDRGRDAINKAKDAHTEYLEQLNRSGSVIADASAEYQRQSASLEYAYEVIERYGDKSGLTAAQQMELQSAIDKVNEACGLQLQLVDPLNGRIGDETGAYEDAAEAIWKYVEAKDAEYRATALGTAKGEYESIYASAINEYQAQSNAAEAEWQAVDLLIQKYGSLEEVRRVANTSLAGIQIGAGYTMSPEDRALVAQVTEAKNALDAWEAAAAGARDADVALSAAAQNMSELQAEQYAFEQIANGVEKTVGTLALTSATAMDAFNEGGYKAELSVLNFAEALAACTTDSEALMAALSDEQTMARFVEAYDGSAASLKEIFEQVHVGFDDVKASELDAANSSERMAYYLQNLNTMTNAVMQSMGISSSDMANSFVDAGISVDQLRTMGQKAFAELLEKGGGDLTALTFLVKHYNEVVPQDKHGEITVDGAELYTANGWVAVWNDEKNTLVWKGTEVEVDATELYDAQGQLYTWNNTELKKKSTSVNVESSSVDAALSKLNRLDSWAGHTINVSTMATMAPTASLKAAGGFRTHADGAIVNRATFLGDIVGEDGSEAIVPLSNRRYAQPFVDMLADGINKQTGGDTYITNVYFNGELLATDKRIERHIDDFMEDLLRLGGGYVG